MRTIKNFLLDFITKETKPSQLRKDYFEVSKDELQKGDVILISGRTRMANVIEWVTNSKWTHAALYIGDGLLIESLVGEGVVIKSVDVYINDEIRICRHKDITKEKARDIINFMADHLEAKYDVRAIFDLLRLMAPIWIMPRKWRSTIFKDAFLDKYTCSELITLAYNSVGLPIILGLKAKAHVPGDFDRSVYVDVIKPRPIKV
jgi:hypothetical protein